MDLIFIALLDGKEHLGCFHLLTNVNKMENKNMHEQVCVDWRLSPLGTYQGAIDIFFSF